MIIYIILFISCIIFFVYYYYSNIYNDEFDDFDIIQESDKTIPKIIFQTYHNKSKIPQKVYDNIKKYAPDYTHIIYDDQEIIQFLSANFHNDVVKKFESLDGAHKADLFRYCVLYIHGGVYLDIKTELIKPLNLIFNKKDVDLYTVISIVPKTIYQGIIATHPKNSIFIKLIQFMLDTPYILSKNYYHIFVADFYRYISNDTQQSLVSGYNKGKKHKYYLMTEKCSENKGDCYDGLDRYGRCCFISDNNENVIKTRYADYPW